VLAAQPGRRTRLYGAFAGALVLALAGYLLLGPSAHPPSVSTADRSATSSVPPRAPSEPTPAGPAPPQTQSNSAGAISGVPEVIDTSTLRLDGKVIRLFGVEWARGAQPEDLTRYLRNRAVSCRPAAADVYRCEVEGRDLSEVVLYNGGGRAASNATPDLLAAENHARSERLGIWRR
jgi:endonuclease YncB( thermonuclease family)